MDPLHLIRKTNYKELFADAIIPGDGENITAIQMMVAQIQRMLAEPME